MKKISITHTNIINLLKIESLPLEKRMAIVDEARDLVDVRVRDRIFTLLPDKDKDAFMEHMEKENEEGVALIFSENNIDILAIVGEEVERIKEELLAIAEEDT